jgi:carbon monoxide dehydrogenase subunit G
MPLLHERLWTRLSAERAFDFVADFANASGWDPGTATSERLDHGPVGVGARYRLGVRMGGSVRPMEYRIVSYERPHGVVLQGEGSGVSAIDRILFEPDADGTSIDYTADIRLRGVLRLLAPLARGRFASIAMKAREGMQRTLDRMAEHA